MSHPEWNPPSEKGEGWILLVIVTIIVIVGWLLEKINWNGL